jgi:hypothetical protein
MHIVERTVSARDREIFDLDEFLNRPLYAHLAHNSERGPRESPVWFQWDGQAIWIIGGKSFPENLKRDPCCAIGIVDWEPTTGLSQHRARTLHRRDNLVPRPGPARKAGRRIGKTPALMPPLLYSVCQVA